jgi:hypothetical protein
MDIRGTILFMAIGDYFWLNYHELLMDIRGTILFMAISGY